MVSLDPNVRPGLIADRGVPGSFRGLAAAGRHPEGERRGSGLAVSAAPPRGCRSGLACSRHSSCPPDARRAWATASTPFGSASVEAPRVAVVDTVGAGDAFTSGALAHLHERGLLSRTACGHWMSLASPSCWRLPVSSLLIPVRGPGQSRRAAASWAPARARSARGHAELRGSRRARSSAGNARPAALAWHHRGTGCREEQGRARACRRARPRSGRARSYGWLPSQQPDLDRVGTPRPQGSLGHLRR